MASQISIIIPVYNAERYLTRCLDSVLNQTFTDFEILLIDDGSTDASGEIGEMYKKKDQRVHVFHNSNKGVSSSRQFGIDRVETPYLTFVDADDFVEPGFLHNLYTILEADNSDLSLCSYYEVYKDTKRLRYNSVYDKINLMHALLRGNEWGVLWNKLFKTSIIRNNSIGFIPNIQMWEDLAFLFEYLVHCHTISCSLFPVYNYIRTIETSLTKMVTDKQIRDQMQCVNRILAIIKEHGIEDTFIHDVTKMKLNVKDNYLKSEISFDKLKLWSGCFCELDSFIINGNGDNRIVFLLLKYKLRVLAYCYLKLRYYYQNVLNDVFTTIKDTFRYKP